VTFRPYNQLTASGVTDTRPNNTGVTIPKATPVRMNSSGELDFVNVSVESEVFGISGVTNSDIANGSSGNLNSAGKVSNITTSGAFGDLLYISKSGGLTEVKPSIGVAGFVAGDFVVSIGVIGKNESDPLLKDLIVNVDIKGQL